MKVRELLTLTMLGFFWGGALFRRGHPFRPTGGYSKIHIMKADVPTDVDSVCHEWGGYSKETADGV